MLVAIHPNGQRIPSCCFHQLGDVEVTADEGSLNLSDGMPVQPDVSLPVDAVEIQYQPFALLQRGCLEFRAIPEVGIEETVVDTRQVIIMADVFQQSGFLPSPYHRSRNGSLQPTDRLVACLRDGLATFFYFVCPLHRPAPPLGIGGYTG